MKLKKWAIQFLSTGNTLVMRAGNLQLSWVASESGIDRQKFYVGRGPKDLQELIAALSEYAKSGSSSSIGPTRKSDNDVSALRVALAAQHQKSRELKAEVNRLKLMHDLTHSGKPLVY
ncbi:hypothetical protein [Pseudomonas sp. MH10]|uniref:hypothetical protein n=1 Tax=Pseudomonas sp. MH10 TaxID=3048627 RepID=UPI002AC9DF70|nr:hypothetical protein [Pseudomonas sp. MH10]MEB0043589.1 hypothetical protein [Pseudomonas sp. MH10]WPX63591.1 hypothetical protein RHM59_22390 [Pseudomonas sp. MH10]